MAGSSTVERPPAAFYFDLASPQAYLASERILHALPGPVEWQPVLAHELPAHELPAHELPAHGLPDEESLHPATIERQADELGLQPLRWPTPFPFDSTIAMLAATYAKSIGRAVPFAQAAFRQAFAGGRSLGEIDNVLIAAAACEMHPKAVLAATQMASVREQLHSATTAASVVGVSYVPAVQVGARVFVGERSVEDAAASPGLLRSDASRIEGQR
jgi:2-hydroxychromene-2-carboxylate isomerase